MRRVLSRTESELKNRMKAQDLMFPFQDGELAVLYLRGWYKTSVHVLLNFLINDLKMETNCDISKCRD